MFVELVVGVGFEGKELCAYAVNREGEGTHFPVADLYRRGLDNTTRKSMSRITTNFCEWSLADPREYLHEVGFSASASMAINQHFFEFQADGTRFVVPALLLMREIFRPAKFLLPMMFRPHALEQLSKAEVLASGETVFTAEASWATPGRVKSYSDWGETMNWMNIHPSAKEMASSVHRYALSGFVGLELPMATAQVVCRGIRIKKKMFVTSLTLTTLAPLDFPESRFAKALPLLHMHAGTLGKGETRVTSTANFVVPVRMDGTVELTDYEWELVEPVLMSNRKCNQPFTRSPRDLLDGILGKLASGKPWRTAPYKVGTYQNAVTACRDWTRRGVLGEVIRVLETSRTAP